MKTIENYAQQALKPEFFESNESSIFISATSGSSPFNEWYEFKNRGEAVRFMASYFTSQSYLDRFTVLDGELFDLDDTIYNEETEKLEIAEGAEPADLSEAVQCESKF